MSSLAGSSAEDGLALAGPRAGALPVRRLPLGARLNLVLEVVNGGLVELWSHKLRSGLTLTLLMLGVFALVVLTSVLDGVLDKVGTGFKGMAWDGTVVLQPKTAETTIPQGVPCTRLANLILAPKEEAQRLAAYVPRWGMQLTANWTESKAWATYRMIQKQYTALIGDREPIVVRSRGIGLGSALRYNIRIADDDRAYLESFCRKLIAAGGACVVLRNDRG